MVIKELCDPTREVEQREWLSQTTMHLSTVQCGYNSSTLPSTNGSSDNVTTTAAAKRCYGGDGTAGDHFQTQPRLVRGNIVAIRLAHVEGEADVDYRGRSYLLLSLVSLLSLLSLLSLSPT